MLLVKAWDNLGEAPAGWGSHVLVGWRDFEPKAGTYRVDKFLSAIERRVRPCYVQILFSKFEQTLGVPVDFTPAHHKRSLPLTVGELSGEIPSYDDRWTEAYCRAVEALAAGLREHPQVAGYWHAAGWNGETQAAVGTRTGDWGGAAQPLLHQLDFYRFLTTSTARAVAAWGSSTGPTGAGGPVPVYLPGAPSPGTLWGTRRRDVIAECLKSGAGYMNCALQSDNDTSVGIGERAGLGMYDIGTLTQRRGFEEGQRQARSEPMELYWMLLRARHWQADFVNLYGAISAPQVAAVAPLLPADDARWIVFRDAEFPAQSYTAGGKIYGHSGELGPWGWGITATGAQPGRGAAGFWFDRWVLDVPGLLVLALPGAADGQYAVEIWRPNGDRETSMREVASERLALPAGRYHRVDVAPTPALLTLEERVRRLEKRVFGERPLA